MSSERPIIADGADLLIGYGGADPRDKRVPVVEVVAQNDAELIAYLKQRDARRRRKVTKC